LLSEAVATLSAAGMPLQAILPLIASVDMPTNFYRRVTCNLFIYGYLYKNSVKNHSLCRHVSKVLAESENDKIMDDCDEIQNELQANLIVLTLCKRPKLQQN